MIFSRNGLLKMNQTKPYIKVKGIDGWLQWDTCKLEEHAKPHPNKNRKQIDIQPLPLIFRAMPPRGHNGIGALYFINNIYMKKPNSDYSE